MKIRKQKQWRPSAPRLKKKLTFEQLFLRVAKATMKHQLKLAVTAFCFMSDSERSNLVAEVNEAASVLALRS